MDEQLTHSFLSKKENESIISVTSSTGGHPLKITKSHSLSSSECTSPRTTISHENVLHIRNELNLSGRKTLKFCSAIRTVDRKVINPNITSHLRHVDHQLENLFDVETIDFCRIENHIVIEQQHQPAVFCTDINRFIDIICAARDHDRTQCLIKLCIDGGGGFLKISLSIFSLHTQDIRSRYLDSGVKKILIVAIAQNVQENYPNLLKLWIKSDLRSLRITENVTIACDLKIANCLLGLMSHGSMYPCCWCSSRRDNLIEIGQPRSFDSLSLKYWEFHNDGKKIARAKHFDSVIHPSIIKPDNPSVKVLMIVPTPELHLLTGSFTTMYDGMLKIWSDADSWLRRCNVQKHNFHGGGFTGNSCIQLLSKVDVLASICPMNCLPYVRAFRCFFKVSSSY